MALRSRERPRTGPPVRRGRPPAAESLAEDAILAAALRSFAAHGYQGTSVRDLNAELGVSHSLIHRRFGSKLDLWKATADRWFGEFVAHLDPVLDSIRPGEPLAAFRRFIVAFIEASAARPELLRMMQLEGALESERLEYVWERHVRPLGQRMNRVVRSLEGSERYTALPATTTFFLLAHGATAAPSHAAAARRIDSTDPTDPAVLRRHADAVADLFLGVDPSVRLAATGQVSEDIGRGRSAVRRPRVVPNERT